MSNYSKTTDFEAKDSLPTGDSGKIIRGAEFETEFDAISTAIATKADTAGPTFTGTLTFDTISDGTIGVTAFVDEDDMSSDSATLVPTQQSVKAYVDSVTTELEAQDLDFQADSGGALSIDLDTETMTFTGGTGITTTGLANDVTFAIDSTVATLTGTQTLTNKTLTSPDVDTPDIDGGTIDGTVIGGTTPAAVSATTVSATGNITVGGTVDGRDVATDGTKLDGIEAGATADQTAAEIRTLVDSATDSNVFTDADHTKLDGIEANATADQTDAEIRAAVEAATDSNVFTDADHTKLDGIEASADVTDTTNVTAAGALMDSELTDITAVKSLDQGVATTDSPTFAGLTTTADVSFGDNDKATFGAGNDLQIFHDGSNSYITEFGIGDLNIRGQSSINLESSNGSETYASFSLNGGSALYYDNAQKFNTTSTGIDVTGTVTADGLTVDGTLGDFQVSTGGNQLSLTYNGANYINSIGDGSSLTFRMGSTYKPYLNITAGGDISFYEDTGTTAKFFWDASQERLELDSANANPLVLERNGGTDANVSIQFNCATNDWYAGTNPANNFAIGTSLDQTNAPFQIDASGNVGIGTSSPSQTLHLKSADPVIRLEDSSPNGVYAQIDGAGGGLILSADGGNGSASSFIGFRVDGTASGSEKMRIDSSGNVKIGTATDRFSYLTATTANLQIDGGVVFEPGSGNNVELFNYRSTDMLFGNSGGEDMRLDSSGNLLVGKTAIGSNTVGFQVASNGKIAATVSGDETARFNRTTSDGDIVEFRKDDTTVGSIGNRSTALFIDASVSSGAGLDLTQLAILPRKDGALNNGDISLGEGGYRYKNMFLSGGVYLGGTGSANKLDDYETGTFTPTVRGSTSAGTASYTAQGGTYEKVGDVVHFRIFVYWASGTGTGNLEISNLPFTASSTLNSYESCAIGYVRDVTFSGTLTAYVDTGGAYIVFRENQSAATGSNLAYDSAGRIMVSGSYRAA